MMKTGKFRLTCGFCSVNRLLEDIEWFNTEQRRRWYDSPMQIRVYLTSYPRHCVYCHIDYMHLEDVACLENRLGVSVMKID